MLIDGVNLADIDTTSWHKNLGVLQQDFISYSFASGKDNIYYGDASKSFDQKRFDAALDKAEARDFLEKLPNGVDSYVNPWMEDDSGASGTELSRGQWQRLALARNFYRDASIIILDEPTSAIDALAESRIFNHLFAEKNKTIITISHRLTTVRNATTIYMLKQGKIVEHGAYDELLAKNGEFVKMFESLIK